MATKTPRRWTAEEDERLRAMRNEGRSYHEVAAALGRTASAVWVAIIGACLFAALRLDAGRRPLDPAEAHPRRRTGRRYGCTERDIQCRRVKLRSRAD